MLLAIISDIPISRVGSITKARVMFRAGFDPGALSTAGEPGLSSYRRYAAIQAGQVTGLRWSDYKNDLYVSPEGAVLRGHTYFLAQAESGIDMGLNVIVVDERHYRYNMQDGLERERPRQPPRTSMARGKSNATEEPQPDYVADQNGVRKIEGDRDDT